MPNVPKFRLFSLFLRGPEVPHVTLVPPFEEACCKDCTHCRDLHINIVAYQLLQEQKFEND